jgi:alkylation response protein AidB-like acyl-CoA dehydrogenase
MYAALTPEQQEVERVAGRLAASVAIRNPSDLPGHDRGRAWRQLIEAGALTVRMRENGQPLASGTEARLFVEAAAAALMTAPILGNTLAVDLLARAGTDDAAVAGIAEGTLRVGVALAADFGLCCPTADDDVLAWDIEGATQAVGLAHADDGTAQVVRYQIDGASVVPSQLDATRMIGRVLPGSRKAVGPLAEEDAQRWSALALTLATADAVGAARQTLDNAIAYSRERHAYGAPIGSFQALQHLMVDAFIELQMTAALTRYAAWAIDELAPDAAMLAARGAKANTARVGLAIAEAAQQVFGGMGVTREHIAHFFSRRIMVDRWLFGGEDTHYAAIADARLGVI